MCHHFSHELLYEHCHGPYRIATVTLWNRRVDYISPLLKVWPSYSDLIDPRQCGPHSLWSALFSFIPGSLCSRTLYFVPGTHCNCGRLPQDWTLPSPLTFYVHLHGLRKSKQVSWKQCEWVKEGRCFIRVFKIFAEDVVKRLFPKSLQRPCVGNYRNQLLPESSYTSYLFHLYSQWSRISMIPNSSIAWHDMFASSVISAVWCCLIGGRLQNVLAIFRWDFTL